MPGVTQVALPHADCCCRVPFRTRSMEYSTLPQGFLNAVDQYQLPQAQMHKSAGKWIGISSQDMLRRVSKLSSALAGLGVEAGDRVAIFAPNSPEWHAADFATMGL